MRLGLLLALLAITPALPAAALAEPGMLEVRVSGVRSNVGDVLVAVCDKGSFLQETCRYRGRAKATAGTTIVRIANVPPGVYAAQAFQDENGNGKLDRTFLGMPREGLGFSNDAKMRFGPPSFDDAAFALGAAGGMIAFSLRYYD